MREAAILNRAPAAHPETTGSRARTPVEDDSTLSTGSTSTWKFPGRRARTPVEDDSTLSTGSTSTWKFPGRRALEDMDSKNIGRVARQQAASGVL
jgi:hypothetical protein